MPLRNVSLLYFVFFIVQPQLKMAKLRMIKVSYLHFSCISYDFYFPFLLLIVSSRGRSPGRAIVLPPVKRKVFYVMGKALSDELSCPCDRSCFRLMLLIFSD